MMFWTRSYCRAQVLNINLAHQSMQTVNPMMMYTPRGMDYVIALVIITTMPTKFVLPLYLIAIELQLGRAAQENTIINNIFFADLFFQDAERLHEKLTTGLFLHICWEWPMHCSTRDFFSYLSFYLPVAKVVQRISLTLTWYEFYFYLKIRCKFF